MSIYTKDPDAKLDYAFDWSDWLASGETISSQTVTASPTTMTVSGTAQAGGTVTYWLTGGTDGVNYRVTCHIVTSVSREDDRTDTIMVRER